MLDDNLLKMASNPIEGCYLISYPCSFDVKNKSKENFIIYNHNYNTSNNKLMYRHGFQNNQITFSNKFGYLFHFAKIIDFLKIRFFGVVISIFF